MPACWIFLLNRRSAASKDSPSPTMISDNWLITRPFARNHSRQGGSGAWYRCAYFTAARCARSATGLAGRPGELAAGEDVQMEVVHRLTGARAVVHDDPV